MQGSITMETNEKETSFKNKIKVVYGKESLKNIITELIEQRFIRELEKNMM